MSKYSVLVIGCGSIGERHVRGFRRTGRADVTACDSNPALLARIAGAYGVPAADSWTEAVDAGAFDAVAICTPAHLHVPMAIRSLQRGRHVLIEKPLSQSLDGIDDLLGLARTSGRQTAVGYTLHVSPVLRPSREFILGGGIGEVLQVWSQCGSAFHLLRPAYAQTYFRSHATGGGGIQDAVTHSANWVESVIGPADRVLCDCAHLFLPKVEVEDAVHLSSRHGRVMVSHVLNQFQLPYEWTMQFNGTKGTVKVELHHQRWGRWGEGDSAWRWEERKVADRDEYHVAEANAFFDQIEGKPSVLCSLEAAAATLRFNLAALASAQSGGWVSCAETASPQKP